MATKVNEPKRNATIKSTVLRGTDSKQAYGLKLEFSHGRELELSNADLSDGIVAEALWHGIKQKLVDAAAISRNAETGRSATVDDKFSAVKDVYQRLLSGLWNEPREGGGNVGGLLLKALCRMYPKRTADDLKDWLAKMSEAQKAALRANPKVAAVIQTIQAEAVAEAGIDSDELLDGLE